MKIDSTLLRKIVEGALLAADEPLNTNRIAGLFEPGESSEKDVAEEAQAKPTKEEILAALEDIQADCEGRGYELKEVGSGWRFQVVQETAPWINRLWEEKPQKYSRALLETLALIAYRQPITRGDIESIRGVAVSSTIIKTLSEREWVKVVGHRDVPGRPALYATTRQFLDYFNLKSLDQLPSLNEIKDFEKFGSEFDFIEGGGAAPQSEEASTAGDGQDLPAEPDMAGGDESDSDVLDGEAQRADAADVQLDEEQPERQDEVAEEQEEREQHDEDAEEQDEREQQSEESNDFTRLDS